MTMTPLERLLSEELPTGTFGGHGQPTTPTSAATAAEHRAELETALDKARAARRRAAASSTASC
ncbi:hypothetical protein [Streptomyces sp. NPDC005322]|uniref:hypothetical protein n=1 Tax=Streptomyces sp. NPDC005322 TaxID=3157032 RepID=UPI0033B7CACF